jgi:hypothetical protein
MRVRELGYQRTLRCRKKIEQLFGEGTDRHSLRDSVVAISTESATRPTR